MTAFFENAIIAFQQVFILYIIVAVGFIADRAKIFTQSTARACNDLLFYIVTPAVIINAFIDTRFTADSAKALLLAALGASLTYVVGILISLPFFGLKKTPDNGIYKFACVYGNVGYMALPLAQAVLGTEGVFYCSMGVIVFQVFCFTHGVWLMSHGNKNGFKARNLLINPGMIGVVIGLPLFLLRVPMPELLAKPLSFVGSMNTPLAMLMLGTYMSNAGFKTILKNKGQYGVALLKIVILPLLMLALFKVTGLFGGTLLTALTIQAGAPSANNTVMFAAKYDRDTGVASKTVAFVSFCSVLTLPLMIALSQIGG